MITDFGYDIKFTDIICGATNDISDVASKKKGHVLIKDQFMENDLNLFEDKCLKHGGTIWLKDGSILTCDIHDDYCGWQRVSIPKIPNYLL